MDDDELEKMGFMKFPVGGGYMGDEDGMLIDLNRLKAGVESMQTLNNLWVNNMISKGPVMLKMVENAKIFLGVD